MSSISLFLFSGIIKSSLPNEIPALNACLKPKVFILSQKITVSFCPQYLKIVSITSETFFLVNNLFNSKYVSYGGYYTYDVPTDNQIKTYEGTYYYPQAEINILVGLDFKF